MNPADLSPATTQRRLAEPLGGFVWRVTALAVVALVVELVRTLATRNASIFGFGQASVCTSAPKNGLPIAAGGNLVARTRPGAAVTASSLQLCAHHPTLGQRLLVALTQAPAVILYAAVLVQLWLLVLAVRRHGPFVLGVSRRLRFLAWFILAGGLVAGAGQALARAWFTTTVVTGSVPAGTGAVNGMLSNLIPLLLIVCVLLTLARIMRAGTQMYDDLAGTV